MNEKRKGKEIKMLTALIQYIIEIIMTSVDLIRRKLYVRILREKETVQERLLPRGGCTENKGGTL